MANRVQIIFEALNKTGGAYQTVKTELGDLRKAVFNLRTAFASLGAGLLVREIVQAQVSYERMANALKATTGSTEGAAREMAFVRAEAERLGLDLETAAKGYTQLAAAAKGTSIAGQGARDVFTAVAEASTVLGLSSAAAEGAIRALSQVMSKGTVQAEELRGQLGERIPGAFQMAARAMGVSAAELNKLLEQGKVLSDDFLPKFAQELRRTFAGALPEAVDSAQANLNRFQTQLFSLKVDLARSGFMDAVLSVLGAISATLKDPGFNQSIRDVGAGFKALAGDGETLTTALGGVLWIVQRLIIGFATLNATRKVLTAGWDDFTFAGLDSAKETLELQIADIEQRLSDLPGEDNPLTKIFNFDALKSSEQRRNLTALLDEAKTKLTGVNAQLAAMGGDKTGLEVFEQEIEKLEKLINRVSNPDPIKIPTVVLPPLQKTPGGSSGVGGEDAEHEPTVAQQLKYLRQVNKELEKSTDGAMESFRGLASQLEATGGPMAQITAGLELYNHETDRAGAGMKDMAEEGNAAFAELENAVEGWASNFSAELNDMFWSADLTFSGILESFGRMLSQMVIQKQIVEPLLGAGMNFLSGLGGGAAPSGGGAEFGAKALGSGNFTLRHDGGPIIPRFHTGGLLSDEVPAILQTGERVLSREQNRTFDKLAALLDGGGQGNAGAVEVNVINNAQGTAARTEERQQGGRRIVDVIVETVEGAIGAGRLDRAMGSNFGVSRSGVRR